MHCDSKARLNLMYRNLGPTPCSVLFESQLEHEIEAHLRRKVMTSTPDVGDRVDSETSDTSSTVDRTRRLLYILPTLKA
jgi:hypothetical protein